MRPHHGTAGGGENPRSHRSPHDSRGRLATPRTPHPADHGSVGPRSGGRGPVGGRHGGCPSGGAQVLGGDVDPEAALAVVADQVEGTRPVDGARGRLPVTAALAGDDGSHGLRLRTGVVRPPQGASGRPLPAGRARPLVEPATPPLHAAALATFGPDQVAARLRAGTSSTRSWSRPRVPAITPASSSPPPSTETTRATPK